MKSEYDFTKAKRGAVVATPPGKTRVTIRLDNGVLDWFRKQVDAAANRYEILIESANDAGPPPDGSHVRVTNIRGSWTVEPGSDGKGSVVRYELHSDPGGRIPAWLADRTQRHAAADVVHAMLKRALEKNRGR